MCSRKDSCSCPLRWAPAHNEIQRTPATLVGLSYPISHTRSSSRETWAPAFLRPSPAEGNLDSWDGQGRSARTFASKQQTQGFQHSTCRDIKNAAPAAADPLTARPVASKAGGKALHKNGNNVLALFDTEINGKSMTLMKNNEDP